MLLGSENKTIRRCAGRPSEFLGVAVGLESGEQSPRATPNHGNVVGTAFKYKGSLHGKETIQAEAEDKTETKRWQQRQVLS